MDVSRDNRYKIDRILGVKDIVKIRFLIILSCSFKVVLKFSKQFNFLKLIEEA